MNFLNRLFGKRNKSQVKVKNDEPKYFDGEPISGKEDVIHIKRIETAESGNKLIVFHFPEFIGDAFRLELIENKFEKDRTLKPTCIHSHMDNVVPIYGNNGLSELRIGISTNFEKTFLILCGYKKETKINEGDEFSILFINDEIETFTIAEKGYKKEKDSEGIVFQTQIEISNSLLEKLVSEELDSWQYKDKIKNRTYLAKFDGKYDWTNEKERIKNLAQMIIIGKKELKSSD